MNRGTKRRIPWALGSLAGLILAVGAVVFWPIFSENRRIQRLHSVDSGEIRRAAVELEATGSWRAIPHLFTALERIQEYALFGNTQAEKEALVSALAEVVKRHHGAAWGNALVELLRDVRKDEDARAAVFQALRESGEEIHGEILLDVLRRGLPERTKPFFEGPHQKSPEIDAILQQFWEDPPESAVRLFNRVLADSSGNAYRNRRNLLHSLGFPRLWRYRKENRKFKTLSDVYPRLAMSDEFPGFAELALALCLIVDGDGEVAQQILRSLDEKLAVAGPEGIGAILAGERRNLPWYRAVGLALREIPNESQKVGREMREFFSRNAGRPEYVVRCVMDVVQALHDSGNTARNRKTQRILMGFLMERFALSGEFTSKVPLDLFRYVVDMYMQTCRRRSEYCEPYIRVLLEQFDPKSLPCVSALTFRGMLRWYEDRDLAGAEEPFRRILREGVGGPWPRLAKAHLLTFWISANQQRPEMEEYIEDLKRAPPEEYEIYNYGRTIQAYRDFLKRRAREGRPR